MAIQKLIPFSAAYPQALKTQQGQPSALGLQSIPSSETEPALAYSQLGSQYFGSQLAGLNRTEAIQFGRRFKKAKIPVLNLKEFTEGTPAQKKAFAQKMGKAFQKYGFIGIQGYNVPEAHLDQAYEEMKQFFELPKATKEAYTDKANGYQRGYQPLGTERKGKTAADELAGNKTRGELKENIHIGRYGNPNFKENPDLKPTMERFFGELEEVGIEILKALDMYMGIKSPDGKRGYFEHLVTDEDGTKSGWHLMRGIFYPPVDVSLLPDDEKKDFAPGKTVVRGGAHYDKNLITLLPKATAAGLQLLTPGVDPKVAKEKDWMDVVVPPNTIIVNSADMLSQMTEGTKHHITSGFHRIVGSQQPRQSCVLFVHPDHEKPFGHITSGDPIPVYVTSKNASGENVTEKIPCASGAEYFLNRSRASTAQANQVVTPEAVKTYIEKSRPFNRPETK